MREKVLNIINHQENENQNHNETSSQTLRMVTIKNTKSDKYHKNVKKLESLWWECKMVQLLWETV